MDKYKHVTDAPTVAAMLAGLVYVGAMILGMLWVFMWLIPTLIHAALT